MHKRKQRSIALALSLVLLSACAKENSNPTVCPAIVPYSQNEQIRAADELDALPENAMLGVMMVDYGSLRNQLRECQ